MMSSIFWDIMLRSLVENKLTFQRKISPPSIGSMDKPSKKPVKQSRATCFMLVSYLTYSFSPKFWKTSKPMFLNWWDFKIG
jgi:hypothetical protein